MLTKMSVSSIRLYIHTHNCYKQEIAEDFYAIFVKNVNIYKNLVKENFL